MHSTSVIYALSKCHEIGTVSSVLPKACDSVSNVNVSQSNLDSKSLHTYFSSLTVHVTADYLLNKRPSAFTRIWPNALYKTIEDLLKELVQPGNAALKDHKMIL